MSEHPAPPPPTGEPDEATSRPADQPAGSGRSGLRVRLGRWRHAGGWNGLWPASAGTDRQGWLLRELVVVGLATLAAIGSVAIAAGNRHSEGMELNAVSVLLLGLAVGALPFRHRYPPAALAVAFLTTLAYTTFYAEGPVYIPMIVTFGQVVLSGRRWVAVGALVAGFVLFTWLGPILGEDEAPNIGQVVGLAAWLAFLLSLTEVIRARSERAREAARSQEEALRRRTTEERLRIARELHDVVAHNMSLISIQAGVALHLMDQRPEQVRESLTTIKQASKEALVELRSILGVLRQVDDHGSGSDGSGGDAPRSPVPGLQRLDELVQRAKVAGLEVRVESDVDPVGLPRDVDLAAYRIIQESLTNVARHSDDRRAEVRIHVDRGVLAVDVLDEGTPAWQRVIRQHGQVVEDESGTGHGVAGMRERATSVGGRLEAGPRPGRGYAVRARLPLGGASRAGVASIGAESEEPE